MEAFAEAASFRLTLGATWQPRKPRILPEGTPLALLAAMVSDVVLERKAYLLRFQFGFIGETLELFVLIVR